MAEKKELKVRDYQIVARCGVSDVPVQLVRQRHVSHALKVAGEVTADEVRQTAARLGFDFDAVACISVVEIGLNGVPVESTEVEMGGAR